jgi:hypothetical protein
MDERVILNGCLRNWVRAGTGFSWQSFMNTAVDHQGQYEAEEYSTN